MKIVPTVPPKDLLSSGTTLGNLACTGSPRGAYAKGYYYWIVGDSESGKTWFLMSAFAEAARNKNFDGYRLIYDKPEAGALMDVSRFFGAGTAERIEPPFAEKDGTPGASQTIEDFYYNIDDALKDGRPFVYALDSMDVLSSKGELSKFEEAKNARRKNKKVAGSYGDGKARVNSSGIRQLLPRLLKSRSILLVVSQTRDDIRFGAMPGAKTFSGGHALKFYATLQIWTSIKGQITVKHKEKTYQQGMKIKFTVKKNRMTGRHAQVEVPIYHSFGIDDTGSLVDFLVEAGHWKKGNNGINAPEFGDPLKRSALIAYIEDMEKDKELRGVAAGVWKEIIEATSIERKSRYD